MATLHNDTFTRAANAIIESHTPETGSGYTVEYRSEASIDPTVDATLDELQFSVFNPAVNSGVLITAGTAMPTAEYDVSFIMGGTISASATKSAWAVARFTDTSNYYVGGTYPAGVAADKKIIKNVAGTKTELASGDNGLAAGDTIKFAVLDATKKLLHNTVEILSTSDNALTSAGKAGFGGGNIGFVAGDECPNGASTTLTLFLVEGSDAAPEPAPEVLRTVRGGLQW